MHRYTWVADVGIGNSIAADLLIAGTMVYIFRSHQSDFSTTLSVMNRLIGYTVGTGAVTRCESERLVKIRPGS
jgi:mannose/fructose/N-acetylgalactosamine-specific phosphotransferase system component IID